MEFSGSPLVSKRARRQVTQRGAKLPAGAPPPYEQVPVTDHGKCQKVRDCPQGNLSMYLLPPNEAISLLEMEEMAQWRLQVLRTVERCRERSAKEGHSEFRRTLAAQLHKLGYLIDGYTNDSSFVPADSAKAQMLCEARRKDYLSHFILRLAFCKSPDMQRWFIQQEVDIFKYRFANETSESAISTFLQQNDLHFEPVQEEVKQHMMGKLRAAASGWASKGFRMESEPFWETDFRDALDLVKGRRVFVSAGRAFVPRTDMASIVVARFRMNLARALAVLASRFDSVLGDERLAALVGRLDSSTYLGASYDSAHNANGTAPVTPSMVDQLCRESFPPCMEHMVGELRRAHHLRHGARMQLGLFLKGIGMPLQAALDFWRIEFTKIIDPDKFEKQYAYNIRHNYGKEGKRTDYTPYNCAKIITGNPPAAADCHGCPFKHWSSSALRDYLTGRGLPAARVDNVVSLAANGRFDRACTAHFEAKHRMADGQLDNLIGHPNQYFELSRKHAAGTMSKSQTQKQSDEM